MDKTKALTHRQQSVLSTEINNLANHPQIINGLKRTIKEAMVGPSFFQLIASGSNRIGIEQLLALLIAKYANMLSVGGNVKPDNLMEYAKNILNDWPTMSLDDMNVLLSNGVKGRYNEKGIIRFDISVIYDWISKYQDEWAAEQERQSAKYQSEINAGIQTMLSQTNPETEKMVDEFLEKISDFKKVPALSDEQIWDLGRPDRPKKSVTIAREKFIVGDGFEVYADSLEEAEKAYEAFKKQSKRKK
jgi:hypothetical protein